MSALDNLAAEPRWVAWRNEARNGKTTKVPYSPHGGMAKADDPATWGTRDEAADLARRLVNGQGGGLGIELGDIGADLYLAGVDLDSCIAEDGTLASWAAVIIDAARTYAETSPSGRGLKLFFYLCAEDVRWFLDRIGVPLTGWGCRRGVGQDDRDHGPAIEVYCAARYFAVTDRLWPGAPVDIRLLDREDLDRLAGLIPPPKAASGGTGKSAGGDKSRSAAAFRLGAALRRAGKSYQEMVEALLANPDTEDWARTKGRANGGREFKRIWDKAAPDDAVPTITVRAGLRHEAADAGLAALDAAAVAFHQRGEQIVRVLPIPAKTADGAETTTPGIAAVGHALLGRELGRAARWEGFNRKGDRVRIDPPRPVVEQIAEMAGEWPFPILAGVIGTPTMRADGSLLLTEGYDERTGLVLLGAPDLPPIPKEPTPADAERALNLLDGLLAEFPFRDGGKQESIDRAVALSELLTPVLRGAMPTAPMHLANAPQPGTGKSYLADLASAIATGERCAVVAFSPKPEETEKRLNGSALGGHPILALDNASGTIEGDLLCQLTERPLLQLRPLGTSKMVQAANTFTVLANGNNAEVAADMTRRTIECRLDANMETPETREFKANPLAAITHNRGAYIAAALTVGRAYIVAGKPGRLSSLASYEAWSDLVRSALVWLGRGDPTASMASLRSTDPIRQTRITVFSAWADELGLNGAHQTSELVIAANQRGEMSGELLRPKLRAALLEIGHDRHGGIEPRRIGRWLSRNENNVAVGLKLTCDRGDPQRPRWFIHEAGR